ncbi:SDR family NAD(P)-dependent oxidoreductase [uncultured Alistipes sp.]|uniref:SDR family NAD(P)-dependent oxidoreductase n=1 Tax=uncultured Alistipes sp. TaxID=538949 RepID=UPI00261DA06E|nr:SDR family NAD(P)-dependent oxidoreductase [uncultured Alistipes sp.]
MANDGLYIVTGATGAIGRALTRALALRGERVVMACRNAAKAEPLRRRIVEETGNAAVETLPLDLSSLRSVAAFADTIRSKGVPVEALVNNAGTMNETLRLTEDGLEETLGVNYAGPYVLSRLLLPCMAAGGRIVNTLSVTYRIGKVDASALEPPVRYTRFGAYARSKLALLLFTLELARRVGTAGPHVYAADPGVVDTDMITMHRWFDPLADLLFRPLIKSPQRGAETAVALAAGELPDGNPAIYWAGMKPRRIPVSVVNHPCRQSLWDETERFVERRGIRLE